MKARFSIRIHKTPAPQPYSRQINTLDRAFGCVRATRWGEARRWPCTRSVLANVRVNYSVIAVRVRTVCASASPMCIPYIPRILYGARFTLSGCCLIRFYWVVPFCSVFGKHRASAWVICTRGVETRNYAYWFYFFFSLLWIIIIISLLVAVVAVALCTHEHNRIHREIGSTHTCLRPQTVNELGSFAIDCAASRIYLFFIYTLASICGVGEQRERRRDMQRELCTRHSSELSFNRFNGKRDRARRTAVARWNHFYREFFLNWMEKHVSLNFIRDKREGEGEKFCCSCSFVRLTVRRPHRNAIIESIIDNGNKCERNYMNRDIFGCDLSSSL